MKKTKQPLVITFMGVDGAGKTTLSKKIKKFFSHSKYFHLKPYILFQDRRTIIKKPHRHKKSSSFVSMLRLLSWLISYKVFFFKNKNIKFCVFDRYAHDILIDPLRYKHNLPESLTNIILSFFPVPDLWIFLKPPFKIIKLRKAELSDNELKRQVKEYSIFFKNKKNVLLLNKNIKNKQLTSIIIKKINLIAK